MMAEGRHVYDVSEDYRIPLAEDLVVFPVEFEPELRGGCLAHFDGFTGNFRAGAVPADNCDIMSGHSKTGFPQAREPHILTLCGGQAIDFWR